MRLLLIAVVAAATLWSGYWWFGSRAVEAGLRGWFDRRADVGWVANYASIRTRGFPNRFDTTIDGIELADPVRGIAWSAPFFQILRLSYRPDHVIAVWPDEQTVATPEGRIAVRTSRARASLILRSGTDLELDRATAVFEDMRLESSTGWSAEAAEGRFAVHASEALPHAVDIGIEAREVRPAGEGLRRLADAGTAPEVLAFLKLDAALVFDSAWNRHAIETRRPVLTAVRLNLLQAEWGDLELRAAGDLTVDAAGLASGSITVKARNWRDMLLFATGAGWLSESRFGFLEKGIDLLAAFSGMSGTVDVPLTLSHGQVSVGPVPLGTLGPLRFP